MYEQTKHIHKSNSVKTLTRNQKRSMKCANSRNKTPKHEKQNHVDLQHAFRNVTVHGHHIRAGNDCERGASYRKSGSAIMFPFLNKRGDGSEQQDDGARKNVV